ncbi:MAG: 23S rRNA pseudouridine(955/2504/2580) synthase RluC [Gammaproteobacteria bacterium]
MSASSNSSHASVTWIEIDRDQAGQRIDNFLLRELKGVPKSRIYRILRKGEVRVNKGRAAPTYRLQSGDKVRIPPIRRGNAPTGSPGRAAVERVQSCLILEHPHFLVVDKPAGMAVHGGSGLSFGLIEAMRAWRSDLSYLELVHRLDRETSGCLLLAKRRSALRRLHTLIREGGMEKRYLALVQGHWKGGGRVVDLPLRKNQLQGGERVVRVDPAGKPSQTRFKVIDYYGDATLVEATLLTGRTHQIRVHAAHEGHPLAGDDKYGDPEWNRALRRLGLKRMFLHAHSLAFLYPEPEEAIHASAPLGEDLSGILAALSV